ncbi:MAG: MogA/MoaB family molybdenum cofactor biosynthesis protein [Acidobacteriota bacterium]
MTGKMSDEQIRAIAVTISDTRRGDDDISGVTLVGVLIANKITVVEKVIISDELDDIRNSLHVMTEREDVDLIVTTGGTGFSPRDNTPEATRAVIDREAPGLSEAIRRETSRKVPMAILSRGICGIRNNTLIINFPGSPKAVKECFEVIASVLPHAIDQIHGRSGH